jgi:Divergent InlB B-repeat domain
MNREERTRIRGGRGSGSTRLRPGLGRALAIFVVVLVVASALVVAATALPRDSAGAVPLTLAKEKAPPEYNVTFTEKGLPSGTTWIPVLAGTHHPVTSPSISIQEGNGTYNWSVLTIESPMKNGVAGWAPNVSAGRVIVAGAPVYINVTFLTAYNVTVHETGLSLGLLWKATLNGTLPYSTVQTGLTLILPNATGYSLAIENPVPGAVSGVRYIPTTTTYTFTVKGVNKSLSETFSAQFFVVTQANPTNGGTVTPASGWVANQTKLTFTETPAASYIFLKWTGNGTGSYSGTTPSPSLTISAPITEIANFSKLFTVTFTESGLPSGTGWSVVFNGVLTSGTAPNNITFSAANGTYGFTVSPYTGWVATPSSGSVIVLGTAKVVSIVWTPFSYPVTFTESGLPLATNWSVTLNGVKQTSSTTTVEFMEPNGTYNYSLGLVSGWRPNQATGSVVIASAGANVAVTFTQVTYSVTFTQSGLPAGTNWTVILGGTPKSSTGTTIVYTVANGTYSFSTIGITGYTASPAAGTIPVNGANVNQPIAWSLVKYAVTFDESGLPAGTVWAVTFAGSIASNVSGPIVFHQSDGSYNFSVQAVPGFAADPAFGTILIQGATVTETIAFLPTFAVQITETGLPSGMNWSVSLNGKTTYANTTVSSQITYQEPNGNYTLVVFGIPGYHVGTYPSIVMVNGAPVLIVLSWSRTTYSVTFTETGLSNGASWSVTLGGSLLSSTTPTITFQVPNGTYNFVITNVSGYTVSPEAGTLHVNGQGVSESAKYSNTSTSTILGLSPTDFGLVVALVVVLALAALLALLLLRRRRTSEKGTPPK